MATICAAPTRSSSTRDSRQYLAAVQRLDQLARRTASTSVSFIWRSAGCSIKASLPRLWGARHPDQLQPVDEVAGWRLDASAKAEIDRILRETITDPIRPEFMAPPARSVAAA